MSNFGVDCYFYYYSTCNKGDSCPFRHCEAAMGNETVCNLWQEGRCHRTVCKFRHMEIKKNRKEIPCYWENQPAGCQKPHCVFYHDKPRYIDGIYVPPSKGLTKNEDTPNEEPAPPLTTPHPAATNPQLRGVIKAETQETVPSPTHPPVVINPADDDEDEDDQFSEGEDGKVGPDGARLTSPRKVTGSPKPDDSLNFGVSTLEEIRLRKALKASMKRAIYPAQSPDAPPQKNIKANGEKENIGSFVRPVISWSRDDPVNSEENRRHKGSVAERLGKMLENDVQTEGNLQLRRSLADRLGGILDEGDSRVTPQKALKPIRDRLGLSTESVAPPQSALSIPDTTDETKKAPEHLHIKTLEEIRQEKAAKTQKHKDSSSVPAPAAPVTETAASKSTKGTKRSITVKTNSISQVKTFSEILHEKKKQQQDQQIGNKNPGKDQDSIDATVPSQVAPPETKVRVKTLEEILREKAARSQALQPQEASNPKSSVSEEMISKKPRLLRINKAASPASITTQKMVDVTDMPDNTPTCGAEDSPASSNDIKVKTFEEIMREKRLRKQEMEEQASSSSQSQVFVQSEPPLKQPTGSAPRRKVPVRAKVTPPNVIPTSDVTTLTQETPVGKQTNLKPKAVSPSHSTSNTITVSNTNSTQNKGSLLQQAEVQTPSKTPNSSNVSSGRRKRSSPNTASKQAKTIAQSSSVEEHPVDKKQTNSLKKSPGQAEPKVRPRLNVKPSVIKPAMQVKPGQKNKTEERSAVAAVKPLNSASTVLDEPLQKRTRGQSGISPSADVQVNLTVSSSPTASTMTEELQTVPVFQQSPVQTPPTTAAAVREAPIIPQSPVLKTPTQGKSRRPSLATSRGPLSTGSATPSALAVDDFDELMNEFTDDHLEEDVDPGMGEDDLLLELSEMIDS